MALGESLSTQAFLAEVQASFLWAVGRAELIGVDPAASLPSRRQALLERQPGFRATLMGRDLPELDRHSPLPSTVIPAQAGIHLDPRLLGGDGSDFTAEGVGQRYEAFLGRHARQRQGSFYTSRPMIRHLLVEPLRHERPRLLDLAMGCGAFLSEALAMRDLPQPAARYAFACEALHGVERDPLARELAVLALWLQIGFADADPRRLMANLRLGNSLLDPAQTVGETQDASTLGVSTPGAETPSVEAPGVDWERDFPAPMREGGFTAVVGNPPFVNIARLHALEKARYREAFPSLQKRFDLFVPMAERALDLTRPGGHLALLLPRAFLNQAYAEPLRRRFLAETTLLRLDETPFPGAAVQTLLLSATKTPAPADHRIAVGPFVAAPAETSLPEALPQAPLLGLPEARIPARGGRDFEVALQALTRGIPLGVVAFATWGIRGVPIADFHRDTADHPACRPMLKGDGIEPYHARWGGKFLRYEPERLYRPLFPELFEGEKLVLRKVSGRRGLVAARDREGFYTDDSVLCVQLRAQLPPALAHRYGGREPLLPPLERYDLSILLAMLNSRLGGLVFSLLLGNGLNVYPGAVMRMPLPPHDPERFAAVRALVERREAAAPPLTEALDHAIEDQLAAMFGLGTAPPGSAL